MTVIEILEILRLLTNLMHASKHISLNPEYGSSISIENNRKEMGHVLEKE